MRVDTTKPCADSPAEPPSPAHDHALMPDASRNERNHQLDKLVAIGLVAGSVAHDLNNLLQVVSARLELLSNRALAHRADVRRAQAVGAKGRLAIQTLMAFIR